MKTHRRTNVLLAAASAAVVGLLLVGCAKSSPDPGPLPEGKAEATASRTPEMEEAPPLGAYRSMWHDLSVASRTSDASSALLDDHARGAALELLRYGLRKSNREGIVSKGAPKIDPQVVTASTSKVVLVDCVDDTDWLLYKRNGELKDNVPGGHLKTDATVQRDHGAWKVTDLYMHEAGSC